MTNSLFFLKKRFVSTDSLLKFVMPKIAYSYDCLLYTSDAADEL